MDGLQASGRTEEWLPRFGLSTVRQAHGRQGLVHVGINTVTYDAGISDAQVRRRKKGDAKVPTSAGASGLFSADAAERRKTAPVGLPSSGAGALRGGRDIPSGMPAPPHEALQHPE